MKKILENNQEYRLFEKLCRDSNWDLSKAIIRHNLLVGGKLPAKTRN